MSLLAESLICLVAAVAGVPSSRRPGFRSVLGHHAVYVSEQKLIQTARDRNEELAQLFRDDLEY